MTTGVWPVIDDRVRVFKKDGGPIDEDFELIDPEHGIYFRQYDASCYLFCKINSVLCYFRARGPAHPTQRLKKKRDELIETEKDLVFCDDYSFYLQGGDVTLLTRGENV